MASLKDLKDRIASFMNPVASFGKGLIADTAKTVGNTVRNVGMGASTLAQMNTQALANKRYEDLMRSNQLARQAAFGQGDKSQLLQQSRKIDQGFSIPNLASRLNEPLANFNLNTRQQAGMEGAIGNGGALRTLGKGISSGVGTISLGVGANQIYKAPLKLGSWFAPAVGGTLGGVSAKLQGQDVAEGIGKGISSGVKTAGFTSTFTDPLISKVAGANLSKLSPVVQQAVRRVITGAGNTGEDYLLAKMEGAQYGLADAFLSGIMGGVISPKANDDLLTKFFVKKGVPEPQAKVFAKEVKNPPKQGFKPNPDMPNGVVRDTPPKIVTGEPKEKNIITTRAGKRVGDNELNALGGMAGFEAYQDENGETKYRYNPTKGVIGLAAGVVGGKLRTKGLTPEVKPLIQEAKNYGYEVKLIDKKPKDYYGKHFSDSKTIEVYTKGRTPEQIQSTIDHEVGHIVDYKRRGIVADPMGDSVTGFNGKLRPASDSDIYFRQPQMLKEAQAIRSEFPKTHTLATTQKEIYADAYKIYKNDPEKLQKIAPNIYKQLDDFVKPAQSGLTPEVKGLEMTKQPTVGTELGSQKSLLAGGTQTQTPLLQKNTQPSTELDTEQRKLRIRPSEDIIQEARKQIGESGEPKVSIKKSLDDLYTQWVDRYHPISKATNTAKEWLNKQGKTLESKDNPELLVRRLTGAGGIADARFRNELNPVLKEMEGLKIDKSDMDVYLASKRMVGFGEAGRDIYGADPVKSAQVVSALEQKYPQIAQIADKMYDYQSKGFQELVDSGFLSKDAADAIRANNPNYAPLKRVMGEIENYLGLPTRKTMQGTNPVAKIKGSKRQIESPVESIIANTFSQRAAIEKNNVARAIVGLGEVAPELGITKVPKSAEDTITVWNNGSKEYYRVGRDIADTAKGVNEETMNLVLKIFQAPASLLRQGATGMNPDFMIPNILKDQLDAGVTSKYGYIPFVDYVSGLKSLITKDDVYKSWENSGAKIDLGELSGRKSIKQLFDATKQKKGLLSWLGSGLNLLGKYSEQPTRLGLYKKALGKTKDPLLAMMESRDATVDFARMGTKMKVANSIIPFLNVGVQGFDKLIRATKDNPLKVALTMGIYGAAPATAITIYNLTNHKDEYDEIPQYEKDSNFVLVRGRNAKGTVDYASFPKGNVLPTVTNPIQSFIEYAFNADKQSFGELATSLISSTLPVVGDGSSLGEVGLKTVGGLVPQAVKPLAEVAMNKSFFKYDPKKEQAKDIVPSYLQKRENYQQAYEWTPSAYKAVGAALNVSPLKVQSLMEGYLAGFVKVPAMVVETLKSLSEGVEPQKNMIPIMRRIFKETTPNYSAPVQQNKPTTPLMERITGKAGAAEVAPADTGRINTRVKPNEYQIESAVWKLKDSPDMSAKIGDIFLIKDETDGSVSKIDISTEIKEPKYSGEESIDKKLRSNYKGDLTRRGNNVIKLFEAGQINAEQAAALMDEIEVKYDATKEPKSTKAKKAKKITIKSVKYSLPKLSQSSKRSGVKISTTTPKIGKSKNRNIVISKPKKIKLKGFKNTLSSSVKLA